MKICYNTRIMKVRCPHCKHVFPVAPQRGAQTCPECSKTLLLPRFFGDKTPSETNTAVLHREMLKRRQSAGGAGLPPAGMIFTKRPMRMFLIIALLVFIGGLLLQKVRQPADLEEPARIELALENLMTLRIAVERFRDDCGRYPTTEEGLAALLLDPGIEGWNGPYILGLKPDPWGRSFRYRLENDEPLLTSTGSDGIPGTDLDLRAPPLPPTDEEDLDEGVYRVRP